MSGSTTPPPSDPKSSAPVDQTAVPMGQTEVSDGSEQKPVSVRRSDAPADKASKSESAASGGQKKKGKITALGDFKLIKKLGKGGMGEVYLAKQVSLDRLVAIKTLTRDLAKNPKFVERFQREARAMAKIHHPNAVAVYAVDSQHSIHFAAIEYVDGKSMQDWLDQLGKLSIGDALHVTILCCEALAEAHSQNMIHRDIKPDNILVTKNGVVKVADFGLAKALDEDVSMTASGTGLGTPLYMPPEQARNAKYVDQRSDIYALGATLYHFVTGELPYMGENAIELITAKEKGRHTPARRRNPEVPERLDLMIDKMLAKDPAHRYNTCHEIIVDLESLSLANAQLSFVDSPDAGRLGRKSALRPSQVQSKAATTRPPVSMMSSRAEGEQQAKSQKPDGPAVWFVRHKTPKGMTISKLTLDEIEKGIKKGQIDLAAKAKSSADGQWIPIAQIPALADTVAKRQVSVQAQSKATSLKSQYAEIDKQHARKNRFRWLKNLGQGTMTWVMFAVMLVIAVAVVAGLWWAYWEFAHPMVQGWLNS